MKGAHRLDPGLLQRTGQSTADQAETKMPSDPILTAFDRRRARAPHSPMLLSRRHAVTVDQVGTLDRVIAERIAASGAGALVGLAAVNGPSFLAGFLAIRRAGRAALLIDSRTPKAEKLRIASGLGATTMLECDRTWPRSADDMVLSPVAPEVSSGRHAEAALSNDIAAIKLTSGSTGAPRGIVTPSAALVADDAALTSTMGLADDERILTAIPLSHSYGFSSIVMPALMRDAVLVLPDEAKPLAPMIVAREREVTFFPTVPAYLQAIVRMSNPPPIPDCLRLVVSAGAPLSPATAARFVERFGQPAHVFYGASECGGICYDRTGESGLRGGLGTPVDGVSIALEPARGTVSVTSESVARGYLPDADPSLMAGRFRTRDVGHFEDGELFLTGRLDDIINMRGKKVNPREIEAVLNRLDGVRESVTLGVNQSARGAEMIRCFVACESGALTTEAVQAWCRRHLAEHKVPRSIILLDAIPKTDRGKLDRNALSRLDPGHG